MLSVASSSCRALPLPAVSGEVLSRLGLVVGLVIVAVSVVVPMPAVV